MKVYIKRAAYVLLMPFVTLLLILMIPSAALLWPVTFIIYGEKGDVLRFFSWFDKLYEWHESLGEE